jgi:hypothetical protein
VSGTVNVNVTNSSLTVTISGTPTINVQTSGGANIVIDKLTVGAYTEDRRTLSNNGASATMVTGNYSQPRGKLFPRGCRGFINTVEVYCNNTDSVAHTLTVYFCVQPGMGRVFTATISVPAGASAAWRSASVQRFWNFDSLFLYVKSDSDSYGAVGSDTGTPYDYYYSSDEIAWAPGSARYWLRVNFTGETVGDLPVSGTLNIIEIPSTSTARQYKQLTVPAGGELYDAVQVGSGQVLFIMFWAGTTGARDNLVPRVKCDGNLAMPVDFAMSYYNDYYVTGTTPGITIGKWDTTNNYYVLIVTVPFTFQRSLEVGFRNESTTSSYVGYVMYIYKKIS